MSVPRPRTDLPTIEDDTRPFWDAAKAHRFLVRKCNACAEIHHYPRPFCPSCWSDDLEWLDASGDATLYTWSTVYMNDLPPFNERLPYIAAVVELAEGPKVMTNLVDCDDSALRIGMALRVTYRPLDGGDDAIVAPYFSPA
jgi:uncharacterized OB-fold protein